MTMKKIIDIQTIIQSITLCNNASETAFLNICCGSVLALDHVLDKPEVTLFWRVRNNQVAEQK